MFPRLSVQSFARRLYNARGAFAFSHYAPASILSTSFAVILLSILGEDKFLKKEGKNITTFLLQARRDNGYFVDPHFVSDKTRFHQDDYIQEQFTFFCLIALDILNQHFDALPFLDQFFGEEELKKWFSALDFSNFWYASNRIMFLLYFFSYAQKYSRPAVISLVQSKIDECFSCLERLQDPNTGFWGTNCGSSLANGCFGAAHIYLFYDFFGREIPYAEKIIDSTLSLHSPNGFILTPEGGACEDYDAVEIYYRLMKQSSYKKGVILETLRRMHTSLKNAQFLNGGFSYKKHQSSSAFSNPPMQPTYSYSSWKYMETPIYRSDMWASFFRTMTDILLKRILNDKTSLKNTLSGYALPGWGFIDAYL